MRFRKQTYTEDMAQQPTRRDSVVRDETVQRTEPVVAPDGRVAREEYVAPATTTAYEERTTTAPRVYDETVTDRRVGYFDSLPTRVNSILYAVLFGIEALLALRFLLVAFGASTRSGFVDFIMNVSWPFARPFSNAFTNRTWDQGIIEVNTLLAIGVWFVIFVIASMLVAAILPRFDERGDSTRRTRVTHS